MRTGANCRGSVIKFYLHRPNAHLWLYDLPGIEHYIPVYTPRDKRR
jgi:hypothetical protein